MSKCETCGRAPQADGTPTHYIGCAPPMSAPDNRVREIRVEGVCEYTLCAHPTKAYSGRGAKPKYCEEHSDPKNRK